MELKKSKFDDKNTRPTLNKLEQNYTKHLEGDLASSLCKLSEDKFYADELEFVFQLLEAELRATDSITMKSVLDRLKDLCPDRWNHLVSHAHKIEKGDVKSAVSHQLTALIELTEES